MIMKYDWSNVDWTKNNGEITRLLHCSKKLVSRKRKQLNQIPNPWKPSYSPVDWGNVDWTGKKAKQIAKELNRSVDVVYLHKRKLCRKPKYDFANADWSLSDNVIGKLLGCPSGVVSYHRKKLNATLSPVQQLKGQLNAIDDWNKSNAEIAKCLHCCTQIVSRTRKRLNKPPAPPSRNAIAWHKTHPEVAAQWHPTRNGNLTPMDVTAFGGTKVWWKCKKGHEFEACVSSRKTPNSCPIVPDKKYVKIIV